jgi:FkbM family methyltransferase
MKLAIQAQEFEQQLNATIKNFQHNFKIQPRQSELTIENFPPIHFPIYPAANKMGGAAFWVKHKHADGAIHEPAMVAALLTLQHYLPTPVFFDIGALYGYFSLVVNSVFKDATICAFEMNPESFAFLEKNLLANQAINTNKLRGVNVGLSDKTQLQHKARIEKFKLYEQDNEADGVALDLITLDDFCADNNLYPTLMKIDVEGYQAKIIPAALKAIAEHKPAILLEFDAPNTLKAFGRTNKEIVKPLFDLGYSLFWCRTQRRANAYFQQVSYDELSDEHEKNSLGLFVQL